MGFYYSILDSRAEVDTQGGEYGKGIAGCGFIILRIFITMKELRTSFGKLLQHLLFLGCT